MNRRYVLPSQGMAPAQQPAAVAVQPVGGQPVQMMSVNPAATTTQFKNCTPWQSQYITNPKPSGSGDVFPSYFRPVVSVLPANQTIADNAGVPIGLVVFPSQVADVPVLNYVQSGVPRCTKCASYLSPYTPTYADAKSYGCPMCGNKNQLSDQLASVPIQSRPELTNPVYDIIAPRQYIAMPYIISAFCIIVDVSAPAVQSGFTAQFLTSVLASVEQLDDNVRIALMTTSNRVTVFDFRHESEFIIGDLSDVNVQFPYVSLLGECREQFTQVVNMLIERPPESDGNCYGSALECCVRCMNPLGGVVVAGIFGRPSYGPRLIPARQISNQTTEVDLLRIPQTENCKFYRDIAFQLNRNSISINLFLVSEQPADASVIGVSCGLTGGSLKYYGKFVPDIAFQMHNDIFNTFTQDYYYNCSIRLRATEGIKMVRPQGTFVIQNHDLISFPILNPHASVGFELQIENPLTKPSALFQLAMLWTKKDQTRMIRIFTFEIKVSQDINLIRSSIDETALLGFLMKKAVIDTITTGPITAVSNFKKECNKINGKGIQLEYFNYAAHALTLCPLLTARHPLGVDGRIATIIEYRGMNIIDLMLKIYPRMFAIDTRSQALSLSGKSFAAGAVFLVHMLEKIIIWVSNGASADFLRDVFGVNPGEPLPQTLPELQTESSQYVQNLIQESMTISQRYLPVEIIPQGDPREQIFGSILVDDATDTHSGIDNWLNEIRTA